jgi:GntR family transcriptional regulator
MNGWDALGAEGPLYQSVQRQMLAALEQGEWRPDEAIPSEKRLCDRFGVSVGTLRKAIDALVADHLLVRRQGLGTFVASHSRPRQFFQFFNISPHDGPRTYPEITLLQFGLGKADRITAEKLAIPLQSDIIKIKNLLSMQGRPVIVDTITLAAPRFKGMTEELVRNRPNTLYRLYLDAFSVNVLRIDERVRAASVNAATGKLLGLKVGDPVLEIRRIALTFNRQPVEWRISHVNTQHYEYVHRDVVE